MSRTFSLNDGGPFYHLMIRLRLVRPSGMVRSWWLALFAWLPLVIGEGIRVAANMHPDPTLFDISVHVRPLVALPMMFVAERLIEPACRSAINSLYVGQFCDRAAIDRIVDRGEHLRDAWWPEAVLAAVALIGGQLALWEITGATGVFHGGASAGAWSFPRVWYVVIALPLTQFVMFRWLWRWAIWSFMLVRIAWLPLTPLATHPDRAAGLSCVARPVTGFGAFAFATGAMLSGAWGTQILAQRTTLEAQFPSLLVFLLAVLAIAVGPLLLFCGHLYRARRRALAQYGDFANEHMHGFHDKWIASAIPGQESVGSSDLQSLNDLGGAFGVITTTRLFVFALRPIAAMWLGAILPMLPLLASVVTVEHVLKRVFNTILNGLPL